MADWSERIIDDARPWGGFRRYTLNEPTTVKIITIEPHQRLSEQRHRHRDELWVVLDDGAEIQIGDVTVVASAGDEFFVPAGEVHRMASATDERCRVLEIAFGHFDEDDIERLSDEYGRGGG